jgi:hypothetical protein
MEWNVGYKDSQRILELSLGVRGLWHAKEGTRGFVNSLMHLYLLGEALQISRLCIWVRKKEMLRLVNH